ncbi:hypothetical protein QAD02_017761 [Eretmocerus hayati]|uniref:Uncharacterized protein n=1 Tax=Eretmocerus hayati TaxID=131215 RepID=A0ACC2PEI0_9HYME|nr:hypothetical protein QAD02_017761 [Eretmocerus hayati]
MFFCNYCVHSTCSLKEHLQHRLNHRHITKYLHCGYQHCKSIYRTQLQLKCHLEKAHNVGFRLENPRSCHAANCYGKYVCKVQICKKQFDKLSELLSHLTSHLKKNQMIQCPMRGCIKKYKVLASFRSHLTRAHRNDYKCLETDDVSLPKDASSSIGASSSINTHNDKSEDIPSAEPSDNRNENDAPTPSQPKSINPKRSKQDYETMTSEYVRRVAQFYMKLECEKMVPAATVDHVASEFPSLHNEVQELLKSRLFENLSLENIPHSRINEIYDEVFSNDPIIESHEKLKTRYLREQFYKEEFDHVQPQYIPIDKKKKTFFAYIPIINTLDYMKRDKSIEKELNDPGRPYIKGVLQDFRDGQIFKENTYFRENPDAYEIILYEDEFEVVSPIGPAKKKHKLLAVYMNVGQLPDHLRSHTSTMKLVALCKAEDFKHDIVYGKIVEDLQKLESGGAIKDYEWRTVESYNEAVKKIKKKDYQGIKFDSKFNNLKHFHVSKGLPPCLGHDLFEGIVAYDLQLFIDYFVERDWITYDDLNNLIGKFPFSSEDKQDQPCPVSSTKDRLTGGACQIWNFLRLFPLLVMDKVQNVDDKV